MKVSIIGSGCIGSATGIGLESKGNSVTFYDVDKTKLETMKKADHNVANSISDAVETSEVLFICVPTPTVNRKIDLSCIMKVTSDIAKAMNNQSDYKLVVIRSTVLPQTTRKIILPLLENNSNLVSGEDFGVCMNPEFLRENSAMNDFLNPNRIVIGQLDSHSGDLLEKLYSTFNAPLIRTDLDTAEMIKYVSNLFLASKISFFNEIFMICDRLGLDSKFVSETVSIDPRIGKYGIYGGTPFDGKCLPKDTKAFVEYVKSIGINPKLLEATLSINEEISEYTHNNQK